MSEPATARAAVVAMRCRGGAAGGPDARGVEALTAALGRRVGVPARCIGSFTPTVGHHRADLAASRGCLLEAGGQVQDALGAGHRPLLVAADAAIALGTLPALARLRPDARVLWLSARGSLHTPATAPDGRLADMSLAGACGRWDAGLGGAVPGERVVLCGADDLAADERDAAAAAGITVIGATLETLVFLQNALDGAAVYLHLDRDALAHRADSPGLAEERLFDLLDAVADSCEVLGAEVVGVRAGQAAGDARASAERVAGLLSPLLS